MAITIKSQYHNTVIAFNNSGIVLKKRSEEDLVDLAIMARRSTDPDIIKLFDTLPDLDTLLNTKMRLLEIRILTRKN